MASVELTPFAFTLPWPTRSSEPSTQEEIARDERADLAAEQDQVLSEVELAASGADELAQLRAQFATRRSLARDKADADSLADAVFAEDVAEKLSQMVLLVKNKQQSAETLLRHAKSLFPDPSDLALILLELKRLARRDKQMDEDYLLEILEQFTREHPKRTVQAGVNVALKARLFAARLQASPQVLRQCYREFLQESQAAAWLYERWVANFGFERRAQVLRFIESALFADMHALDPSCSRLEFGAFLYALRQLRLLRSCDSRFTLSMRAYWSLTEPEALEILLEMLLRPYEFDAVLSQRVAPSVAASDHRANARLWQGLMRLATIMPSGLYDPEEAHEHVLELIQQQAERAWAQECPAGYPRHGMRI